MRLIFFFAVVVLWVLPRAVIAEYFVKDVSDIWRNIAADESATWSEEEVAASKAKTLLGRAEKADGFEPLFGAAISNATCAGAAWSMTDGVLAPTGRGDIWTRERYGNFMLELEFKCAEDSNSGVFIRCDDVVEWLHRAIEVQILQPEAGRPEQYHKPYSG